VVRQVGRGSSPPAWSTPCDWAERHHDIAAERHHDTAIVNDDGELVAKCRITETVDGFNELVGLLAEAGDSADAPLPIGTPLTAYPVPPKRELSSTMTHLTDTL
jgi:hypothetical protein